MKTLAAQLDEIQHDLATMFQEVHAMVCRVSAELQQTADESDPRELHRHLTEKDDRVDELDVGIEERCMTFLALQQPVALDLRKIIAVSRIIVHLERIADICVNVASRLSALSSDSAKMPQLLIEMAQRASEMLAAASSAYREGNVAKAEQIRAEDDLVDDMQRRSIDEIVAMLVQQQVDADTLLNLFSITRQLERIADHVVGISEEIIFFVEGRIVRHEVKPDKPQ